ncbi:MAG TPA: aminopeptidase [Candidatus Scatomorpha merdigallinarum]|nr:aminopeptidase [Candidatus Scatomorpha merdigallinarum]
MDTEQLRRYARLIAVTGGGIMPGQSVVLRAGLDQPEFVLMLAEECYRAGAAEVEVEWEYQPLAKLDNRWQSVDTLGTVKPWQEQKLRCRADSLPVMLYLESADPDGLAGIDQQKRAEAMRRRYAVTKPISDAMENRYQWCIAAVPGAGWARKVFPGLPDGEAVERLWEAILSCSRALDGDPAENWAQHNAFLTDRCRRLNSMGLVKLEYRSANGTDLTVGLIPEARFLGGAETNPVNGAVYNPNIPSEEVYITPRAGEAEGIVYATRPLAYRGQLIEDFWIRFEGGRAVDCGAGRNEEALRALIAMDEGSCMLGECALVPYESPIRNSGIMFYNTLFDENAACHLALGRGYTSNIENYGSYTLDELRAMGVNDSMVHEDFMIGSADLAVTGIRATGERVPIFTDGGWAF